MPDIPIDSFQACDFTAPEAAEWAYRSQVAFSGIYCPQLRRHPRISPFVDLITFVCIVAFVFKFNAKHGQSRMTRLMRTILQDSILYFFVMAAFHIAIAFFTFFTTVIDASSPSAEDGSDIIPFQPSIRIFPPIAITVYVFYPFCCDFSDRYRQSDTRYDFAVGYIPSEGLRHFPCPGMERGSLYRMCSRKRWT